MRIRCTLPDLTGACLKLQYKKEKFLRTHGFPEMAGYGAKRVIHTNFEGVMKNFTLLTQIKKNI